MNGIVLIAEILAIVLIHAVKLHQSDKTVDKNIVSESSVTPADIKTKLPYLFVNMLK